MRIWAFPSIYPIDKPGLKWSGIFAHRQYKGLIENGAELTVIVPVPWNPPYPISQLHSEWKKWAKKGYPARRMYDGIVVYHPRIANMKPGRFVKKAFGERYIDAVAGFFRHNKIVLNPSEDIFYSQWIPDAALIQQAAHQLGVKSAILGIGDDIIIYPHDNEASFNLFKKTLTEADLRCVNADYLGREANKTIGANLPFNVVYFGVDYNQFKPVSEESIALARRQYDIPRDKVIILTVGAAIKRKGWLDLFDALQQIKEVNDHFLLVGVYAAPDDFNMMEEVEKRGLGVHFRNIGEIQPAELNRLYNAADIFCLPSHWEGMANVVIEAMSSGLPVITTNVCGHPEIITNGANGILIPPHQPGILAKEILELMNSKEKRTSLGDNARHFIVDEWGDFSDNAAKLYHIFEQTLSVSNNK